MRNISLRFHALNVGHSIYISHCTTGEGTPFPTRERSNRFSSDERELPWNGKVRFAVRRGVRGFHDDETKNPWKNLCCTRDIFPWEKFGASSSACIASLIKRATERRTLRFSRERVFNWKWHWRHDAAEVAARTFARSWLWSRMRESTGAISSPWAIPAARAIWRASTCPSSSHRSTPLPGVTVAYMLELFTFWSITAVSYAFAWYTHRHTHIHMYIYARARMCVYIHIHKIYFPLRFPLEIYRQTGLRTITVFDT